MPISSYALPHTFAAFLGEIEAIAAQRDRDPLAQGIAKTASAYANAPSVLRLAGLAPAASGAFAGLGIAKGYNALKEAIKNHLTRASERRAIYADAVKDLAKMDINRNTMIGAGLGAGAGVIGGMSAQDGNPAGGAILGGLAGAGAGRGLSMYRTQELEKLLKASPGVLGRYLPATTAALGLYGAHKTGVPGAVYDVGKAGVKGAYDIVKSVT